MRQGTGCGKALRTPLSLPSQVSTGQMDIYSIKSIEAYVPGESLVRFSIQGQGG